jgi:hypothetical protein
MHPIVSGLCEAGAVRLGKAAREVRFNQTKALKKRVLREITLISLSCVFPMTFSTLFTKRSMDG